MRCASCSDALRFRDGQALAARPLERVIRTGVEIELLVRGAGIQFDRRIEQTAVMADQQQRALVALEVLLKPDRPFKVEIVRRFVEKQQVRVREQHGRERHAHAPATGEVRAGAQLRFGIEAEASQDFSCPRRARDGGANVRQPGLDLGDPHRVRRGGGLRHQRRPFDVSFEHGVEQGSRTSRHFLRHATDAP